MHVFRVWVDDEGLDNLHEVEGDWEHVHSQIVNVDIEAIALIWSKAVSSRVVHELVCSAVSLQIDTEDVHGCEDFERCVEYAFTVVKSLNQVIYSLDCVMI